jgi:hypothetical protein
MEHRLKDDIPLQIARRKFLAGIGAVAAATAAASLPGRALMTAARPRILAFTLRTSEYLVEQFRRGDH